MPRRERVIVMNTVSWNSLRVIGWLFGRLLHINPFAPWSRVDASQTKVREQVFHGTLLNPSQGFHEEGELNSVALHLLRVPLVDVLPEVRFAIGVTGFNTLDYNSHLGQCRLGLEEE